MRATVRAALGIAGALAALATTGCGETTFTAQEFVEEANAEGAALVLGGQLETLREEQTLHSVGFESHDDEQRGHDHAGGTLVVTPDDEAALAEYERCESSATLVCYRAANVALYFEGAPASEDRAGLEGALRAMAEG